MKQHVYSNVIEKSCVNLKTDEFLKTRDCSCQCAGVSNYDEHGNKFGNCEQVSVIHVHTWNYWMCSSISF